MARRKSTKIKQAGPPGAAGEPEKPALMRMEVASDKADMTKERADHELLLEIHTNYNRAQGAEVENRRLFAEDMNFVYNAEDSYAQWDPAVLQNRRNRPSYTFNRCLPVVNMIIGDFLQIEPQLTVRAVSNSDHVPTASVYEGIIRSIEQDSRARAAVYNPAFKHAVAGGFGVWRILPEYQDDNSFDQVLRIRAVPNPLTAFWDPECQCPYRSDAMWGGFAENISRDTYKVLYPDLDPTPFEMSRDQKGWINSNQVRIVEYYKKVPITKTILQLSDGRVVDKEEYEDTINELNAKKVPGAPQIIQERTVKTYKIQWVKVDGVNVLDGPIDYNWTKIPIIRLPGRYIAIEGRQKCQSVVRHTKDQQRAYNLHRSTMIESAALTPRAPYIVTPKMVKAYEDMWATANTINRPYLLYDIDGDAVGQNGRPVREPPPDVPAALVELAQQDLADIQAATGYFDASLGSQVNDSDRTSGRALVARQRRGDLGSFEFIENFNGALEITYRCLIDMIRHTYDSTRIVRIIGKDEMEKFQQINGQDLMNDLSQGQYDVTCTIGPGLATARLETLETLIEAAEIIPAIGNVAPDIVARNIDTPDADEIARRLRIPLIQQGLVQPTPEEQKNMPPPPPPDPMQVAELQRQQALAKKDQANAVIQTSKAQNQPLDVQRLIEEIVQKRLAGMKLAKEINSPDPEAEAASLGQKFSGE